MKLLLFLALPLLAEDSAPPTAEQQLADANKRIAQLEVQLQQTADAYTGCVVSRANTQQRPALNPAQQRMMQRGKPPEPKEETK